MLQASQYLDRQDDATAAVGNACRMLNPVAVHSNQWLNRPPAAFENEAFRKLKADIASCGGNVQPIKVRPAKDGHEIIFGHRRHRACLELGLPVLALIVEIDDRGMWHEMERENRCRVDLSPYEQGMHYVKALEGGLFSSIRSLASFLGVDSSQAAKVVKLAGLPHSVVAAFESPDVLQVNWATALHRALERDHSAVAKRAEAIASDTERRRTPSETFEFLCRNRGVEPFHTQRVAIRDASGEEVASIRHRNSKYIVELRDAGMSLQSLEERVRQMIGLSGAC